MNTDVGVVTMVLAGGKGERLFPLTQDRSKPSVPFGGNFRIIDFTLMNCVLSGIRRIHVLTQYHSHSLSSHVQGRWSFLRHELGEYIETVPPKMRTSTGFYRGTADAIYRNLDILERYRPNVVLVLSGDHVYRADFARFITRHLESGADATVLCGTADVASASSFGVLETEDTGWIREFVEKPADPLPYARNGACDINLGVYCFTTRFLVQRLVEDAKRQTSHDFGKNILPESLMHGTVLACPHADISPDPTPYWRDVGSIDSYFRCHQDLLEDPPAFDLLDPRLPPESGLRDLLPSKMMAGDDDRRGWSLICSGARIDDALVYRSVISPRVKIGAGAVIDRCVLLTDVEVGAGAHVRDAIVDTGSVIPEGARIGHGGDSRSFTVSPGGVVVVAQDYRFPPSDGELPRRMAPASAEPDKSAARGQRVLPG